MHTCTQQYLQLTALHQLDDVIEQHVSVPLTETINIIRHLDGQTADEWTDRQTGVRQSRWSCDQVHSLPCRRSGG